MGVVDFLSEGEYSHSESVKIITELVSVLKNVISEYKQVIVSVVVDVQFHGYGSADEQFMLLLITANFF